MKLLKALAVALAVALPCMAQAQTSPNWTFKFVPTPAQWNAQWASKQDWLGSAPILTTGGTLTGPLTTAVSTTTQAGLNLPPGAAPTSPNNGDIWSTTAGFFGQVNGATVGPFTSGTSGSFTGTSPIVVSFPGGGIVNYACATCGVIGNPLSQFAATTSAQLAGVITNETGAGLLVFNTSPSLVTPVLGVATATSINGLSVTTTTGTLTLAAGKTLTDTSGVGASILLGATGGGFAAYGGATCTNQVMSALSAAGAPTCVNITNAFVSAGSFSNITGVGTLTAGATGAGFTVALGTSTVTGNLALANIATGTQDTILGYFGSTAVSAIAPGNCSNALTYSTSTHTFGCNSTAGTGTVTQIVAGLAAVTGTCTTSCPVVQQTAHTTWTPVDASGASLTFTGVSANFTQIGNMVFAYAQLTYPTTANTSSAAIGGFPVAFPSSNYGRQCTINFLNAGATIIYATPVVSSTNMTFAVATTGNPALTNVNLSTLTIIFECIYPAT